MFHSSGASDCDDDTFSFYYPDADFNTDYLELEISLCERIEFICDLLSSTDLKRILVVAVLHFEWLRYGVIHLACARDFFIMKIDTFHEYLHKSPIVVDIECICVTEVSSCIHFKSSIILDNSIASYSGTLTLQKMI